MCTAIVLYNVVPAWPIVVGFNRDERYERPSAPPVVTRGKYTVLAPVDLPTGGTWLGVNSRGLFACIVDSNRGRHRGRQSRGRLVHELLRECADARMSRNFISERDPSAFSSSVLLAVDGNEGRLFTLGSRFLQAPLTRGVHVMCDSAADGVKTKRGRWLIERFAHLNERATLDAAMSLLIESLSEHSSCGSRWYTTCCHSTISGTVSSQIVAIDRRGVTRTFLHAEGAPCGGWLYREFTTPELRSLPTARIRRGVS